MTAFQRQWLDWEPNTRRAQTDKADKSVSDGSERASVSIVSSSPERIRGALKITQVQQPHGNTLTSLTDKADKSIGVAQTTLVEVGDGVPEDWAQGVSDLLAMSRERRHCCSLQRGREYALFRVAAVGSPSSSERCSTVRTSSELKLYERASICGVFRFPRRF